MVSVILSALSFVTIWFLWDENKPNSEGKQNLTKSYTEAFQELKKREVISVAVMESLFMATNSIFLFAWTPILQSSSGGDINVGIIFICFIMSMITGTMLFEVSIQI
jgi:predicted MFS family arabinose efflux permease